MKAPRVIVRLDRDQSDRLRFLQEHLPVRPPLTGLVRGAIDRMLHEEFGRRGLTLVYEAERPRPVELVP